MCCFAVTSVTPASACILGHVASTLLGSSILALQLSENGVYIDREGNLPSPPLEAATKAVRAMHHVPRIVPGPDDIGSHSGASAKVSQSGNRHRYLELFDSGRQRQLHLTRSTALIVGSQSLPRGPNLVYDRCVFCRVSLEGQLDAPSAAMGPRRGVVRVGTDLCHSRC